MQIPLSCPSITDVERQAVLRVLDTNTLSIGPELQNFEKQFSRVCSGKGAVAVNSGTSGLHLALKAIGIQEDDEVITTPFSFVASANCVLFERARPVFVDIDPVTYNLDASKIVAGLSTRTKAILPVHVFGRPCDMHAVMAIAKPLKLWVVEDACEALGATYFGQPAGTIGDVGVFAFYPNKQITTGEGGMIVTGSARIAESCRRWRNQGRGEAAAWLQHEDLGYNYRLPEMSCALGTAQLTRLDEILAKRRRAAKFYTDLLAQFVPEVNTPVEADAGSTISWFVYVVRLQDQFTRAQRDQILRRMNTEGVGCSNYFSPIHLQPFYRQRFGFAPGDFPIAEKVSERTIALPFFTEISEEQMTAVTRQLAQAVAEQRRFQINMAAMTENLCESPSTLS